MPKFRKKPVVIEAEQLDRDKLHRLSPEFRAAVCDKRECAPCIEVEGFRVLHIHTLEGAHVAIDGDWIIKGVQGEFYPCKPDIFALTYDEVTE